MDGLIEDHLIDFALLVRVADYGGFTAAAKATGYPQATISRRIANLEKQLSVRLLDRSTRRVALTDAGRRVYEHARLMLDQAEAVRAVAQGIQAEPSGNLRVMSPVVFGQAFVGQMLGEFMTLYPKVKAKLEFSSRSVDLIEDGFDIAIHIGRVPDSSLAMSSVGTVRTALYASAAYLDNAQAINDPSELSDHSILMLGLSLSVGSLDFQCKDQLRSVTLSKRLTSNDVQPLLAAAQNGVGIAVLPSFTGDDAVRQSKLIQVLPTWNLPEISVNAITPSTRGTLPAVRQFLALLKRNVQSGHMLS